MAVEPSQFFNEPAKAIRKDTLPPVAALVMETLGTLTRARLDLEWKLRVCRTDPGDEIEAAFELTPPHREVLLHMLGEFDSPLSASLRASAAAIAGPLRLQEAVPILRGMALDANEDRRTRLNAIGSYISLNAAAAADDLRTLLHSGDADARAAALTAALQTDEPALVSIARNQLRSEQHERVRAIITRRFPALRAELSTKRREGA